MGPSNVVTFQIQPSSTEPCLWEEGYNDYTISKSMITPSIDCNRKKKLSGSNFQEEAQEIERIKSEHG